MDKKINRDQCIKYSGAFTADEIQVHQLLGIFAAVKVGVPKLGNCLKMYTCPSQCPICTSLDTLCTLELLLGYSSYTGAAYMLGHSNIYGRACTW